MRISLVFFFSFFSLLSVSAQSISANSYWQLKLEREMEEIRKQDSISRAQDSLQMLWIGNPIPDRKNQFVDSLKELWTVKNGDILAWGNRFKENVELHAGLIKSHRELWILLVIGSLILFFSILKLNYSSQLKTIVFSAYSKTALTQLNKEEKIYNRWPFALLYIVFGFTIGMFIFMGVNSFYYSNSFYSSLSFYALSTLAVVLYFLFKVLLIKLLGFVFEAQLLAKEYNSIVLLSYFNVGLFLLPIVMAFAFLPQVQVNRLFLLFSLFLFLFFVFQVARAYYSTLMAYKFSKFYLILYFCTLEIGPLVIISKAVGL